LVDFLFTEKGEVVRMED